MGALFYLLPILVDSYALISEIYLRVIGSNFVHFQSGTHSGVTTIQTRCTYA
jgi:hypothetical protein